MGKKENGHREGKRKEKGWRDENRNLSEKPLEGCSGK